MLCNSTIKVPSSYYKIYVHIPLMNNPILQALIVMYIVIDTHLYIPLKNLRFHKMASPQKTTSIKVKIASLQLGVELTK